MDEKDKAYVRLQRHLDRQAVGFPATRSGAEIRILKHIFTPREAEVAACLTYQYEPIDRLFERAGHLVDSAEELEEILARIEKKGGIETKIKAGRKHYCNAPLVVGMFEFQLGRMTAEFLKDFDEYTGSAKFGLEFVSTKLPQMRTIPIAESINQQHRASTFDDVSLLLRTAEPPFAVFECICRKKKALGGKVCQVTARQETCLAAGSLARMALQSGLGRELTREESLSILADNQKEGLVLQPSNTEKAEFICSCCGCCCGMLGLQKHLAKPVDFWASNFHAAVDASACVGCGVCARRCQVGAAIPREPERKTTIDLNRCIGCGVCVPTCPSGAIALRKKSREVRPPQTREELYDVIKSHRKGWPGKLQVAVKLLIDAIRTGQTGLLK